MKNYKKYISYCYYWSPRTSDSERYDIGFTSRKVHYQFFGFRLKAKEMNSNNFWWKHMKYTSTNSNTWELAHTMWSESASGYTVNYFYGFRLKAKER